MVRRRGGRKPALGTDRWSLDFVADQFIDGRRLRILVVVDDCIGRLRGELLNETLFRSLSHTRAVLEAWRADYNNERPHSRLGWMSPAAYAATRRSAALRSTDDFAPQAAATTAQQGITDDQTPIVAG